MGMKFAIVAVLVLGIISALLFSAFIGVSNATTSSVEITPSADTYVSILNPVSNYGGTGALEIAYNENSFEDIWLKFNLADGGIPGGATIDSATLKVYPSMVSETFQVDAYYCQNSSWDEYTINFMNEPADYITKSPTALDFGTTTIYSANNWFTWDVTSAVQSTLDYKPNSSSQLTLVLADKQWSTGLPVFVIPSREAGKNVILLIQWSVTDPNSPTPNPITPTPEPTSSVATPTSTIPGFSSLAIQSLLSVTGVVAAGLLVYFKKRKKHSLVKKL